MGRRANNEQMEGGNEGIRRVDRRHEADREQGFDGTAIYIQVAGGLNLAALKKFSVAGSVNLPTMWGMKTSPQIRRRTLTPLEKSKLCK